MSSLQARGGSPVVSEKMQRAIRGLGLIRKRYGEEGIARLKRRVRDIDIRNSHICALTIGSGKEYDDACCDLGLSSIEQRAYYGFTHDLGERPSYELSAIWKDLIRAT